MNKVISCYNIQGHAKEMFDLLKRLAEGYAVGGADLSDIEDLLIKIGWKRSIDDKRYYRYDIGFIVGDELEDRQKAKDFREKYLMEIIGTDKKIKVDLDFSKVKKISPSFANEAFAYFMEIIMPSDFKKKVGFLNISHLHNEIIDIELTQGYNSYE